MLDAIPAPVVAVSADDFTLWLRDLLAPRGVPAETIKLSYDVIAEVLGPRYPTTIEMLARSAATL